MVEPWSRLPPPVARESPAPDGSLPRRRVGCAGAASPRLEARPNQRAREPSVPRRGSGGSPACVAATRRAHPGRRRAAVVREPPLRVSLAAGDAGSFLACSLVGYVSSLMTRLLGSFAHLYKKLNFIFSDIRMQS